MKNFIKLKFINKLEENLNQQNGFIQVVLGPRQVGKTTSILNFLDTKYKETSIYESADLVFNTSAQWLTSLWNKALSEKKILVIDEIQKCENWSETLKSLYDQTKKQKKYMDCILLGSSSLEIQKGLTESLTGRFQLLSIYHWNFNESKSGYNLNFDQYLKYGGYPGSYTLINKETWVSYVQNSIISTVIEKDILAYQNVKSPALFKQAFEILMSYPAQEISYTKLLGQLQDKGNTDLIKYYIQLYEGAFLIKALEKFSAKAVLTKSSSPKILPLAPCFYYLTLQSDLTSEEKGRVFEMIVGAQLIRTGESVYYWREKNNEVDYILKKGKRIWAIEVKSGRNKSSKGLLEFKKKFEKAALVLIDFENYFEFEKGPLQFLEQYS